MDKLNTELHSLGNYQNPLARQWPSSERCGELLSSIKNSTPEETANSGIFKLYTGALNSNDELFEEGIGLLEKSAGEGFAEAELELAWLSCFSAKVSSDKGYEKAAVEKFPALILPHRIMAFKLWSDGKNDEAGAKLKENLEHPNSEFIDEAALQQFSSEPNLNPFGGYLCRDEDFGNLHHPSEDVSEPALYQLYLIQQLLKERDVAEIKFQGALIAFFVHKYELALDWLQELSQSSSTGDVHSFLGYVLEKTNDIQGAVEHYKKALKIEFHPLASTNLSNIFLNSGNLFLVEKLLSETLSVAPEYAEALSLYGRALCFQKNRQEEALDYLKKAIQNDSEVPEYHLNYCLGLLQTGSIEKLQGEWSFHKKYMQSYTDKGNMRRLFNIVIAGSKDPFQNVGVAEMLNQNGFHEAARYFVTKAWRRAYTIEEKKKKEFSYFTGLHAAQSGEFETALEAYRAWEKYETKGGVATICTAMALNDLNRVEEALTEINTCDTSDPKVAPIKAGILWKLDKFEEAVGFFIDALSGKEVPFTAFFNGVKCAVQSKDSRLEKLIQLGNEKWPDATHGLALSALSQLELGNTEQAISELENRLKDGGQFSVPSVRADAGPMEENVVAAFNILGFAYLKKGIGLDELLNWLDENVPQGAAEWEVLKAEGLRQQGQLEEALSEISGNNTLPSGKFTKALIFESQGKSAELKRMVDELLDNPWILKNFYHGEGDILSLTRSLQEKFDSELNPV